MENPQTGQVRPKPAHAPEGEGQGFSRWVRNMPARPRMYVARGVGEFASNLASPIAMVVVDKGFHQPYEDLKNRLAKSVILPDLQKWDDFLGKMKSFDPPFERQERHALGKPEQARKIADLLVDQFGVKFGASLVGQFLTQDYFINHFHANVSRKHNAMSVLADRGVQLGSTFALNTVAANQAVAMQHALIKVLQKVGMHEEKAEEWANYAVNFGVPNALAYLVSAEMLTRFSRM